MGLAHSDFSNVLMRADIAYNSSSTSRAQTNDLGGINYLYKQEEVKQKKIGIRILGCMALLSMVGCGRIEGASVQDLSNTKDAIVESETTLAENNNEYSNKNSLFYSDISSYEIFTDVNSEAALKKSLL